MEILPKQVFTFPLSCAKMYLVKIWICLIFFQQNVLKIPG